MSTATGAIAQTDNERDLPLFNYDIAVFPGANQELAEFELFVWVRNTDLQFIKKETSYDARYQLNTSVYDKNGVSIFTQDKTYEVTEELFSSTIDPGIKRPHVFRDAVPPGEYVVSIRLYDLNTNKSRHAEQSKTVKLFEPEKLNVSDVLILNSSQIDSIDLNNVIPPRHVPIQDRIFLYAEIVNPVQADTFDVEATLQTDGQISTFNFSKKMKLIADRRKLLLEVLKENMRQGRNLFTLKINTGNQSISIQKAIRFVTDEMSFSYDSVDDMVGPLSYVADGDEWKQLKNAQGAKRDSLFQQFWDKRNPNPGAQDNPLYDEFYKRVRVANKSFTKMKRAGWVSDRGRVYIVYGAPDRISRNDQQVYSQTVYEIWYYDTHRLEFVFEDRYGFGDYKLVSGNLNPYY
ncbi:MAG: GWxTD domain-containing protein [Candidatus Zhuqueibacterota bacterium]